MRIMIWVPFDMKLKNAFRLLVIQLALAAASPLAAQPIAREEVSRTVEALNATLAENYVFPDIAAKVAASLRSELNAGSYDALASKAALAHALTDDLIKVSGDLHFVVGFDPVWVTQSRMKDVPSVATAKRKADHEGI